MDELASDEEQRSSSNSSQGINTMAESNLSEADESSINNNMISDTNLSSSTMKPEPLTGATSIAKPSTPIETEIEADANEDSSNLLPHPSTPSHSEIQLSATKSSASDLSFNFDIDEDQLGALHHHDGNILNEEELKSLAQSLAPRVTSLLDTNEKVLADLMNEELLSEGAAGGGKRGDKNSSGADGIKMKLIFDGENDTDDYDDDENYDGIEDEWNGLSNAEQMLRDELGMVSMGFSYQGWSKDEEYSDEDEDEDDSNYDDEDDYYNDNDGIYDSEEYDGDNNDSIRNSEKTSHEQIRQQARNLLNEANQQIRQQARNLLDEGEKKELSITKSSTKPTTTISTTKPTTKSTTVRSSSSLPPPSSQSNKMNNDAPLPSSANRQTYTLYDHAKYVDLQFSNIDLGYPTCPLLTKEDAEALLDVPSFRHEMLSVTKINTNSSDSELNDSQHTGADSEYSSDAYGYDSNTSSHIDDLQRPMSTQFTDKHSRNEAIREIMLCTREYVKPMSRAALSRIYEGLVDRIHYKKDLKGSVQKQNEINDDEETDDDRALKISASIDEDAGRQPSAELLPVRTVAIQIRPDVLCGAVMDAVHTAVHSLRGDITRRQGNHLRALVPGCWVPATSYVTFRPLHDGDDVSNSFANVLTTMTTSDNLMNGMVFLPPFVIDAQLCARKRSRDGERICLFRFFRIAQNQVVDGSLICPPSPQYASIDRLNADPIPDLKECNGLLRESSALFQRMRLVAIRGGNIAFDMNAEHNDVVRISNPKSHSSSSQNETVLKQVLKSPLKLFSPSKDRKNKTQQEKKKAGKKSLSVRFQSNDSVIQGEKAAQEFASRRLLSSFEAAPSVADENDSSDRDPIPSLSAEDWPFVQSSWRYITLCLNELDNRDLNYSSLVSCPFGAFPALPTLDVQLCSQIKSLCKNNMIKSLLKGASDLEEYARESEYKCAKLIQLLQPTFLAYNLESPQKPDPISLASYPLDFEPPEVSCPPWGQKVIEALNLVAAESPSADSGFLNDLELNETGGNNLPRKNGKSNAEVSSEKKKTEFQKAREAAALVLAAFMKQEDEELSARLGRKNLQVMDRLAKMQAHKRDLIITIRDSYGTNLPATKYANRIHTYIEQALKESSKDAPNVDDFYPACDQVPLMTSRSISGKYPATCFVTCHQILLVTHPILGRAQVFLAKLNEILITTSSPENKSVLNPISSTVTIFSKESKTELFSFRPLMGARPFKEFVDILMDVASESAEILQFSSRGGLLHMFEEKKSVQEAALGKEK